MCQPLQHPTKVRYRMSYPRQLGNHDSACLASRDLFEHITEPRPLEWSLMLALMLADDRQEAQAAPVALSGDLHRLSSQFHVGALVMLLLHARIPEHTGSVGCWDLVRRRRASPYEAVVD